MAEEWIFTAKIINITRMPISHNGNPRYRLTFDDGHVYSTAVDASIAYAITNSEYRDVEVQVTLRQDQIIDVAPVRR